MWRYWVGAVVALVLLVGGVLWWRSTAVAQHGISHAATASASPDADDEPMPATPAASEKTREEKRFSRSDHDKNGAISRDEFLAARHRNFAKLDVNNDGRLTFDEYAVKAEEKFGKADADKSGSLNPAEFATTRVARKAKAACACQPKGDDGD
ncbi:EF-hand domain-containing protein [Sphingomonas crusticola]|uniref:EF-hand domain-containing protein n=1 Tax=Sphingomonas crusticola TaxID=1697973 RepID=UPI000E283321|nr:histidine kinase [Sphingomonas crusticola]